MGKSRVDSPWIHLMVVHGRCLDCFFCLICISNPEVDGSLSGPLILYGDRNNGVWSLLCAARDIPTSLASFVFGYELGASICSLGDCGSFYSRLVRGSIRIRNELAETDAA
jgi:hypothetical protein